MTPEQAQEIAKRLDFLADWFDAKYPENPDREVQADLRRFAEIVRKRVTHDREQLTSEPQETRGVSLIELAFSCPLMGIRLRWPNVLHAVEMDGLPIKSWPDGTARSVCGKTGVRVVQQGSSLVPWPPYAKGLAENGKVRCPECFEKCKKKKPVVRFKGAAS